MEKMQLQDDQIISILEKAVRISARISKIIMRVCQKEAQKGCEDPYLLEEMVMAYAIAISKFSQYKVDEKKLVTWLEFENRAQMAVRLAFDHLGQEIFNKQKL